MPIHSAATINPELAAQERLEEITNQHALELHTALYSLYQNGDTNGYAIEGLLQDQEWYLDRRNHEEMLQHKQTGNIHKRLSMQDESRLNRYTQEAKLAKDQILLSAKESHPYALAFHAMLATEEKYTQEMHKTEPDMFKQLGQYSYRSRLIQKTMQSMNIQKKPRPNS